VSFFGFRRFVKLLYHVTYIKSYTYFHTAYNNCIYKTCPKGALSSFLVGIPKIGLVAGKEKVCALPKLARGASEAHEQRE